MKLAHRHSPRCGNDENRLALAAHAAKADISNVVSPVGKIKMTTGTGASLHRVPQTKATGL
ncbi:hypothetical protein [Burkholderia ubonensis]|uniref:hypothetical protein n=1 Tax=Burkholderia ubonensis TaxID=101571 RepID=UPI0012F9987E|nr:hypothetical protein [Burkholderia ubonensis]